VIPELKGKFDGLAVRVPTPNVSLVDLVIELEQEATVKDVNQALKDSVNRYWATPTSPWSPSTSRGPHSSVVDGGSTKVIGTLAKVLAWYDNEWVTPTACWTSFCTWILRNPFN